jgi:signal transduction histidine kinase
MERSVLQCFAAFRWGAWLWMATVLLVNRNQLDRPWLAIGLVGLALAVTVGDTILLRTRIEALTEPGPVLAELAVGIALLLGDGIAFGPNHAFSDSQSLGLVWPLAGILAAGAAFGPVSGVGAAFAMGAARLGGALINGASVDTGARVISLASTVVFYVLGGAAAGYLVQLLRRAEGEISAARAREEVARTLHDGVLQTLAVVERRADDPELARLARDQERELRDYLFGVRSAGSPKGVPDLGAGLRAAAARYEDAFGGRVQVLVADDLPALASPSVAALIGAAGEALVNAGKHGHATRIQVYVEPDDNGRVFCSVKDDGAGFDPDSTPEGVGLSHSIRQRLAEVGGRMEIRSRPGNGAEVLMWVP